MAGDRDDALSWDGDDDPTLDAGTAPAQREPASAPGLPDGYTAVGRGRESVGHLHTDGTVTSARQRHPLGNAALITLGVLGGFYLLYLLGWLSAGLRLEAAAPYLAGDVMFQASRWLAVLAPALWFATVLLVTRRARPWQRFVWLAVGVLVLIPWPFLMAGAV